MSWLTGTVDAIPTFPRLHDNGRLSISLDLSFTRREYVNWLIPYLRNRLQGCDLENVRHEQNAHASER